MMQEELDQVVTVTVQGQNFHYIGILDFSSMEEKYIRLKNPLMFKMMENGINFGRQRWGNSAGVTICHQNTEVWDASEEMARSYFVAYKFLSNKPIEVKFGY